jgi:hypothetical protein
MSEKASILKSILTGAIVLAPAVAVEMYLIGHKAPLQASYFFACVVLFLGVIDFGTVVMIEPQRKRLSSLTMPAFLSAMAVVLLYVISESLNRFVQHLGYEWLTPFAMASIVMLYGAVFIEKNLALKCQLSLNSIAVTFLWAMGSIDKVTMPF